ncbi:hypothetical protein ALP17_03311 [Pseudomonas savastanoi]|uniref:Uncharacterized protein n=1 Tax=Pseudomonas savastanoi TaxID=29438 RepID=A0A3M6AAK1_PSESS|nr:hypothetical protein ALP17_03311 [Pseudomonas savastanoi]
MTATRVFQTLWWSVPNDGDSTGPVAGAKTQKTSPLCPRERKEMSDVFVVKR